MLKGGYTHQFIKEKPLMAHAITNLLNRGMSQAKVAKKLAKDGWTSRTGKPITSVHISKIKCCLEAIGYVDVKGEKSEEFIALARGDNAKGAW